MSKDFCNLSRDKYLARQEAVVDVYRLTTSRNSIHNNRLVVTLCGRNNLDGRLHKFSEISQFLEESLITSPKQYLGIDKDLNSIKSNISMFPNVRYLNMNIQDVFSDTILGSKIPELVFFDTNKMGINKKEVIKPLIQTLNNLLQFNNSSILVPFNFCVFANKGNFRSPEEVLQMLWDNDLFKQTMTNASWFISPKYYRYFNGTIGMAVIWFLKHPDNTQKKPLINIPKTMKGSPDRTFNDGIICEFKEPSSKSIIKSINNQSRRIDMKNSSTQLLNDINELLNQAEKKFAQLISFSTVSTAPTSKNSKSVTAGEKSARTKKINKKLLENGASHSQKIKDPKWVAAGKKSARRRKQNQERIAKGLEPLYTKHSRKK